MHRAYFTPESLILVAAPSERQSAELVRKCVLFASKLGVRPRGDGDNAVSIAFPNRSRIVGLPNCEHTIRGFSAPAMIVVDEAARVPDELYYALLPMLATCAGHILLMSTPHGKRGFFYDEYANPESPFTKLTVPATDCPRIPKSFLEEQSARMPRHVFEQEYLCHFHAPSNALFSPDDLAALVEPESCR
ncbi:MAG: hypothetical protein HYZ37_06825 [Candidatus Solibacter usitatus]|nr:hypothetical protein [Candidatus Solibacter usitatus]